MAKLLINHGNLAESIYPLTLNPAETQTLSL